MGGYVRDRLLGREPREIDLAVGGSALGLAGRLADRLGGRFYVLDEARGFARILVERRGAVVTVDVAAVQGSGIEEDLARRDFTVNAMALPLTTDGEGQPLVDPLGGREDLQAAVLRPLGPGVFQADPVRLLRAVRLEAQLGFRLTAEGEAAVREQAALLAHPSRERLRQELGLLLELPRPAAGLRRLVQLGLAEGLFPSALPRPDHALTVLEALERLVAESPARPALGEVLSGGQTRLAMLRLAALLHHAGRHDDPGLERRRLEALLLGLRFGRQEAQACATPATTLWKVEEAVLEGLPRRRLFRLLDFLGPHSLPAFLLWGAHQEAAPPRRDWQRELEGLLRAYEDPSLRPEPVLSGDDLMAELSLEPGPSVGWLLSQVREAQAEGLVRTRQEALEQARRLLEEE